MVGVFYKMQKRPNSTIRPGDNDSPIVYTNLYINDSNSSITNMEIRLLPKRISGMPENDSIFNYNYCAIVDFHRYYFVTNWTIDKEGYFTAVLEVDVLGSFRECILSGQGFIVRCSNDYFKDARLSDTFYPARNHIQQLTGYYLDSNHDYFTINPQLATYIIEYTPSAPIAGAFTAPQTYGTSCFLAINPLHLATLVDNLSTVIGNFEPGEGEQPTWKWFNGNTFDMEDIVNTVAKNFCNPMQYIKGIKLYPFAYAKLYETEMLRHTSHHIILGGWNSQASGFEVNPNQNYYHTIHMNIPRPQYNQNEEYAIYPPFVTYYLYNPLIGTIDLDPLLLSDININSLKIDISLNLISGLGRLELYVERYTSGQTPPYDLQTHIQTIEFNACMDIAIAQKSIDGFEVLKSVASFASGNAANATTHTGEHSYNDMSRRNSLPTNSAYGNNKYSSSVTALNEMNAADKTLGAVNILKSALPVFSQLSTTSGGFFSDVNKITLYCNYQMRSKPEPEIFGYLSQQYGEFTNINVYGHDSSGAITQRTFLQAQNVIIPQKHSNYTMTESEHQSIISNLRSGIFIETETDRYG